MLKLGETVEVNGKKHTVVVLDTTELPCKNCTIEHCYNNKEFDELKAEHDALSCIELIPLHSRFEILPE